LRAWAEVEDLPGRLEIDASGLGLHLLGFSLDPLSGEVLSFGSSRDALLANRYVTAVVKDLDCMDLRLRVKSNIPIAAGLGSSAAIVVATLGALNEHMQLGLSYRDIAKRAHGIERAVQRGLGSPMDTALATFGGYQLVGEKAEAVDLPPLDLVVGCTGRPHETGAEVAKVQELRLEYGDIVDHIFQAIGCVTAQAVPCIREGRLADLGRLMNINHGLLEALGVGTRELAELVYAARGAGRSFGAKLTGAGGGGCMIALPSPECSEAACIAIQQAGGRAIPVATGCQGLRLEPE